VSTPKLNIRKILFTLLWFVVGVSGLLLLVAAVRSKNDKICKGIEIEISGVNNNFFIDKADVLAIIKKDAGGNPEGRIISAFNLREVENNLKKNVWIKNAELFFDNNEILRVEINEREPVARIFSADGKSFYIDSSSMVLPLSDKFSARLPVFTGFSGKLELLSKADSNLIIGIRELSMALEADSFLMAMIDQVDITQQRNFELIPKIGNQLIVFGTAEDVTEKLYKLRLFYKAVITKIGWSKYSVINLQYKNQVVAKIKDAEDKTSDSLRVLQIMQIIAERSARQAADSIQVFTQENDRSSADSSMIQQSVQREDEPEQATGLVEKPAVNVPAAAKTLPVKSIAQKVIPKKMAPVKVSVQKPKAVMNR
jgi:cell division protein FtsQ